MDAPLRLFAATGVELEYMIVDADTLSVRPMADRLLAAAGGPCATDVEFGPIGWSNELALHVVELKTTEPVPSLDGLEALFQEHVGRVESLLAPEGARLMPTGMHPWMDPRELRLWPHEPNAIYETFDRIFGCRGHGWANLQSVHVNLPFGDDDEFGRLHAAIRMVLPILPGLAASSPFADGRASGLMDTRLEVYRHNAARIPSVVGRVIPERVFTRAAYERDVLGTIYDDLAPVDPAGVLRHEWVNARGCIARFDRQSIEIRVLDVQECPVADLSIVAAVTAVVEALTAERWTGFDEQCQWSEARLERVMLACIRDGDRAVVDEPGYAALFGYPGSGSCSVRDLWHHLVETTIEPSGREPWRAFFDAVTRHGCLARRIVTAVGTEAPPDRLAAVYRQLADCLTQGRLFVPDGA
jgi:gamma-glutamyl:cysteine ligase YbdK (ATP-grasp superfamily)